MLIPVTILTEEVIEPTGEVTDLTGETRNKTGEVTDPTGETIDQTGVAIDLIVEVKDLIEGKPQMVNIGVNENPRKDLHVSLLTLEKKTI